MSELEPDDSRDVTNTQARAPGEPPRTGPREDQARAQAQGGQQAARQAGETPTEGGLQPIEGDSPEHPDRMGAFTGETADGQQQASETEDEGDRWHQKAQQSGSE